jgi:hypothetical protein
MSAWKFAGASPDGQKFDIEGINVWDYQWVPQGKKADVKDPLYHQDFHFSVYEISAASKKIVFAAGEFSNSMWGFYIPG